MYSYVQLCTIAATITVTGTITIDVGSADTSTGTTVSAVLSITPKLHYITER